MAITSNKNRSQFADITKGIGIILVVMEHHRFINIYNVPVQIIILSFHMPLFYFMSGIFFNPKNSLKVLFLKRLNSLVKPYLSVCFIFAGLYLIKDQNINKFIEDILGILYGTGRTLHRPYGALWFLPSLFITSIFCYFIHAWALSRIDNKFKRICIIFIILTIGFFVNSFIKHNQIIKDLPWNFDLILFTVFFYYAGFESKSFLMNYNLKTTKWMLIALFLFIFSHIIFTFGDRAYVLNFFYRRYDNLFINTIMSLSGIFFILLISKLIDKTSGFIGQALSFMGQRSLTIFMFHSFMLPYAGNLIGKFVDKGNLMTFILTVLLTVIVSLASHEILSRIPLLSNIVLNKVSV